MGKFALLFVLFAFFLIGNCLTQTNYNYFISNSGRDTNSGTSKLLPRQTIRGTAITLTNFALTNGSVSVGLNSGNIFNETLNPSYPLHLGVYSDTATYPDFAILNGSERFDTGWNLTPGTLNIFQQDIIYSGFTGSGINGIGNYSIIYVIEIDRQLEQTNPFTARKLLKFAASMQASDSITGSFYEPVIPLGTGSSSIKIFIHTSNNNSPNGNAKFRYEVTVRDRAVNSYNSNNNRFENLWVRGYGAGYGSLPGGSNSYYNKIIFGPGAAIHHIVTKNATLNNCLFLPGPKNTNGGALVFYDVAGLGRHNKVSKSIFLDIKTPIYAHTSGGTNYGAVELDNISAFADTTEIGGFISTSNNDSVLISNTCTYNYPIGFNFSSAKFLKIENTNFVYTKRGIYFGPNYITASVNNVFINSKGKDNVSGIVMQSNTSLQLTNSIIHIKNSNSIPNPDPVGLFVEGLGSTNHINASGNIFICDAEPNKPVIAATTNTNNGLGTSSDAWTNNVYILLRGNSILWNATNPVLNGGSNVIQTFSEWQRQSGQDQHSLFFDLRNDPRGLQAIFIDPDNGNYELANTVEGNQVAALKAGMTDPLRCFLKKPTYEEAAEMIRTEKVPTAASCRNPCQKAKPTISFSVTPGANGLVNVCQNSELTLEASANFLQNDLYYHQSVARQRYLWWSSDNQDTMGVNLHSLTRTFDQVGPTEVRLQMVDENGCTYDTVFTVLVNPLPANPDLGRDTSLCTGETLVLEVMNKDTQKEYEWSTGLGDTVKAPVTVEGSYWVSSKDGLGCRAFDTINVVTKSPISVSIGRDTMYCSSNPYLLSPVITGQVKSYEWSTGSTTDTVRISGPGTYIVTAKDFGVCIAKDTVVIGDNLVNSFLLPADTIICEGTTYPLNLAPPAGTGITWSDGQTGNAHIIRGGLYRITAVNEGCIKKDELRVDVQPFPVVKLGPDITLCNGFSIPLGIHFPGAGYLWSNGSTDSILMAHDKGIYWGQASINGCSYRDSMELKLISCDCNLQMPNAFSPNGDGINDFIRAKMDCFPKNFNLSIFNRYGQLIYTSRDYRAGWDGKLNGKPQLAGTYYYILSFSNETLSQSRPFSGSITLLR